MKKFLKIVTAAASVLSAIILSACGYYSNHLPDEFIINNNESFSLKNFSTISLNNQLQNSELRVNSQNQSSTCTSNLTLLNIIPIKEVNVHCTEKKFVNVSGNVFGVKFYSKGVIVVGCEEISTGGVKRNPGTDCGIEEGDIILKMNEQNIIQAQNVNEIISASDGNPIKLTVQRDNEVFETNITPVECGGMYKIGLWIKDSCAGLGTMTFYTEDNNYFAALGHGICDTQTNEMLPLQSAELVKADIGSVTKGSNGLPGSINGYFNESTALGEAVVNCETGLYGIAGAEPDCYQKMEIAPLQEVTKGQAYILSTLDNSGPQLYTIDITHVNYDENNKTKNLEIVATDKRLLAKTGGIVQGMSGSPIIQNNKLVGAVTHVLIANSNKGYGIFAQNMYEEIEKCF